MSKATGIAMARTTQKAKNRTDVRGKKGPSEALGVLLDAHLAKAGGVKTLRVSRV